MQGTSKTYIKSKAGLVKSVLAFLSLVFMVGVVGICTFVIISFRNAQNYEFENAEKFDFVLENNEVTILRFLDEQATECFIPASVSYGTEFYPVTKIDQNAFTNHRFLTNVEIPESVTHIMGDKIQKKGAFSGCTALESIKLGSGLTDIGAYAFKNCTALKSLDIPNNIKVIEQGAFQNCLGLQTLKLNSNIELPADCFLNCLNVTTLELDDSIILDDNKKMAFANLTGLTDFLISATNPNYAYYDDKHHFLLNTAKDTIVLAGKETTSIPLDIQQVSDWSFGARARDNLLVSKNVQVIAPNAFDCHSICTDAEAGSIPEGWLTTVPVYTNAKEYIFHAKDQSRHAMTYRDNKGTEVLPLFEDVFPDMVVAVPFITWNLDGNVYDAVFEDSELSQDLILFNGKIAEAGVYIINLNTCLLYTIDFWEEYKSLYYRAEKLETPYNYLVTDFVAKLNSKSNVICDPSNPSYQKYLENKDWKIGLKNLVDYVKQIDDQDYDMTKNSGTQITNFKNLIKEAEMVLNGALDKDPNTVWRELRAASESLTFDISNSSPLGALIIKCENLKRTDYKIDGWQYLQDCLSEARNVTEHNMNISIVRHKLENAYLSLQEVGLEHNIIVLDTWISICDDLSIADYKPQEYEALRNQLDEINENKSKIDTQQKINAAVDQLKLKHSELVPSVKLRKEINLFNLDTIPYFILAVILFTGAVITGSLAAKLKLQLRRK